VTSYISASSSGITSTRFLDHASIYAIYNLEGHVLQVDALLEAEGSEVLGILILHLSIENLIAISNAQRL